MGKLRSIRKATHPFLLFLVAFFVGSLINAGFGNMPLTGDQQDYYELAQGLARSGDFGQPGAIAYRAPLYPYLLSFFVSDNPHHLANARSLNVLLGALMVSGAAFLVQRFTNRVWVMYLSGLFVMMNSYWWLNQVVLMQENLASVLLTFSLVCWPRFGSEDRALERRLKKHGLWLILSGVLFGLSQLAKPGMLPFWIVLPLLAWLMHKGHQRQTHFAFALCFLLIAGITILPWTVRNGIRLGTIVPVTTGSGEVFWGSHAPDTLQNAPGMWLSTPLPEPELQQWQATAAEKQEVAASRLRWAAGWRSLFNAHPLHLARHFAYKVLRLWSPSVFFDADQAAIGVKPLLVAWNLTVLVLFFWGLPKWQSDQTFVYSALIAVTLTTIVFWGTIRFQYPLLPIIAAGASLKLRDLLRKQGWLKSRPSSDSRFSQVKTLWQ